MYDEQQTETPFDRTRVAQLVPKSPDETRDDLFSIYTRHTLERAKEEGTKVAGQQEAYHHIGADLIQYHFSGTQPNLAEIYERFHDLGSAVGMLTTSTNDRGLVDESFSWLGRARSNSDKPSDIEFNPSAALKNVPYMDQLTPVELLGCFIKYQDGLISSALADISTKGNIPVIARAMVAQSPK